MRSSKSENFIRIAERRTERVLEALRLLRQCSNERNYEYSDAQVKKIFSEIRRHVRESEQCFQKKGSKRTFRL